MIVPKIKFDSRLALTAAEMRKVDQVAVKEGLQIRQMMEWAALQTVRLVRLEVGKLTDKKILIVAGKGNNGADAIASARVLANWGAKPIIMAPKNINDHGRHHLELAKKMGLEIKSGLKGVGKMDAVIDGILGYSIKGKVRKPFKNWIEEINRVRVKIFSIDVPSGLDPDDGSVHGIAVKADFTLTLAYPKKGLLVNKAKPYVGQLYLADIGIPEVVYKKARVSYKNPFTQDSLVKII